MARRYTGKGEATIFKRKDGRSVARYHIRTAEGLTWEPLASNPASSVRRPKDRTHKMRSLSEVDA